MLFKGLPHNHHSLTSSYELANIASPLKNFGIEHFLYARIYKDFTAYCLVTHRAYHKHHFERKYLIFPPIPQSFIGNRFYYLITGNESFVYQPMLAELKEHFNIWYPFYYLEYYEDFIDLFVFCSTPNNPDIINFYYNNIDLIDNFKFYFKDTAKSLIFEASKNKIILPEQMRPNISLFDKNKTFTENKKPFIPRPKYFLINYLGKEIPVTEREMNCINLLKLGYTMKEIAIIEQVSPRTIETRMNYIKDKLGIRMKSDMIKALHADKNFSHKITETT